MLTKAEYLANPCGSSSSPAGSCRILPFRDSFTSRTTMAARRLTLVTLISSLSGQDCWHVRANEQEVSLMHNELTKKDIELMKQELDYRKSVLRPQLIEAVKTARGFGDLSENFEYKAAKKEKNRNDSRCRYLENMIRTAIIISDQSQEGTVGLYDHVTLYLVDDDETMECQIVTTMRQDALKGLISKESPVGKAVLGRKKGDRVTVQVNEQYSYDVIIQNVIPGQDDGQAPLVGF